MRADENPFVWQGGARQGANDVFYLHRARA